MEIPDSVIGWGIGVLGAIVGWLVRLEARLNARPTRAEQEAVAHRVAGEVNAQFNDIKRILEKQNENTLLHSQLVGDSLADIRTKVAILRDRVGSGAVDNGHR